jgi:hypothetical protein
MRRTTVLAASFLGLGFAWVSCVMLFVEPRMGFESPADFLDPQKVAAGYTTSVWLVSSFVYLAFPIAVMAIAIPAKDQLLRWSGAGSALLWLTVGAIDRVGIQLPDLITSDEALLATVAATLPTRLAILKGAVIALGVLAWRTTRTGESGGPANRVWRGFGWVVLALSVAFMFAFIPVPVVFAIWGLTLAAQYSRTISHGAAADTAHT